MRQPGFLEWLQQHRRRTTDAEVADVVGAIAREAKRGSVGHARLLLQITGMAEGDAELDKRWGGGRRRRS